ncbi:MAG TPA: hypothetical protein VHV75_01490 [Solirubrobacteraceae bacterium]|jgi:hypothetical protein|nr:hypothetical protein [Solirubrobacteraceae bacterium]
MRELTTYDLEAELLPARELMGCAPKAAHGQPSFSYTSVYNQGSGDGNGNGGFIVVGNGTLDGNNVYVL